MASKETQPIQVPLTIRGHHLYTYAELLRNTNVPLLEFVKDKSMDLHGQVKFQDGKPTDEPDTNYIEDVMGTTAEQTKKFEDMMLDAFKDFLSLPDDFSVEIISTGDTICAGCAIGNHCLKPQKGDNEDMVRFAMDLKPGGRKRLKLKSMPPDKISTTLGTVRRVLRRPDWDYHRPLLNPSIF